MTEPETNGFFGKSEAEIEALVHDKLQTVAKQAAEAATAWADGFLNDRVTVKRKVINQLNEKLTAILLNSVDRVAKAAGIALAEKLVQEIFTEEYIRAHPDYDKTMKYAEESFWREFYYRMSSVGRSAGEAAANKTAAVYEKSLTALIKNAVTSHFEASDALTDLAGE